MIPGLRRLLRILMSRERAPIRILVVDDDRPVADSLALIVRGRGFDSRAVYSGEEAAEVALAWQPNVVLTDVVMGKMDGVTLAIYLAQALPACKVLLMSGNLSTANLLRESAQQGYDFPILAKPFHPQSLLDLLGPSAKA